MALSTLERFRLVATEFASIADSVVNGHIEIASERIDAVQFGSDYQQALAYLAAHQLAIAGRGGNASGPVVSERAGELSITYGYAQASDALETTAYGRAFIALRQSRPGTHLMTTNQEF